MPAAGVFRLALSLIAIALAACAEPPPFEGTPAMQREDLLCSAFLRMRELDPDPACLTADIEYRFVTHEEWTAEKGELRQQRGATADSGDQSWWRISVLVEHLDGEPRSVDELDLVLEHEFLHALLDCSGADWADNMLHRGRHWHGLL